MHRWLLAAALVACSSEEPRNVVEDKAGQAAHAAKVKAVEAAQLAAREAEAAANAASSAADKAQQEMLAAKDELAKTSAERAKLVDQARAMLATARAKLTEMEAQLATMTANRNEAKAAFDRLTGESKAKAKTVLDGMEKKLAESTAEVTRLRVTMADLEKLLVP